MVKHVVKRDGRVVIFDKRKIVDAVLKAMDVTEEGEDIVLAAEIASAVSKIDVDNMSVEDIQDHVEMELMNSPRKEVAKKYIAYRNQRNLARKAKSREIFQEIIQAAVPHREAFQPAGLFQTTCRSHRRRQYQYRPPGLRRGR